jgi:hypothetical protein
MQSERRKANRRKFTYYLKVLDANSLEPVGYLTEISALGIQVDSEKPITVGTNFKLRLDLTPEIANKSFMTVNARTKWCNADKFTPNNYNVGFEVVITAKEDVEIFQRMIEKYGTDRR